MNAADAVLLEAERRIVVETTIVVVKAMAGRADRARRGVGVGRNRGSRVVTASETAVSP